MKLIRRDTVTSDGGNYRVFKRYLVSTMQVLLQVGPLKMAEELPDATFLVQGLLSTVHQNLFDNLTASGIGLPDAYRERGKGFANMNSVSEQLGGCLVVEKRGDNRGATVTCVIPHV